jgi:hypothetical protein
LWNIFPILCALEGANMGWKHTIMWTFYCKMQRNLST